MTSPATTQNVSANSNATSSSASYASAAGASGKAAATPVIATGSSSPVVVGSSSLPTNASTSNARPASVSPLNGSAGSSNTPTATNANMSGNAAPSQGAPATANGSSSSNNGKPITPAVPAVLNGSSAAEHARKSSVTISATGPSSFIANGGSSGAGAKAPIPKFGYDESPAIAHSTPSQPIAGSNQQIPSPAQSPIPIPQPSASGGRPPSVISQDGASMKFGSFGGDGDRHLKHGNFSNVPGSNLPVGSPSAHYRRGSTHSVQSDMGNHAGNHPAHGNHNNHGHHGGPGTNRGGFQPGGGRGGRGYNGSTHYNNQAMPFQPGAGPYPRGPSGGGRGGMAPQFQPRGGMHPNFGPNSPQTAAARVSPAIPPAVPNNGTPQMQNAIPVPGGSPYMQMQYANTTGFPPHSNVNTVPFPHHFKSSQQEGSDQQGQNQPTYRGGVYRKKGARGGGFGSERGGFGGGDRRGDRHNGGGGDRHFSYQPRAFDSASKCSDSQKQQQQQPPQQPPLSLQQRQHQQQQQQQQQQPHKKEHEQQQQQQEFKKGKPRRYSKRWPDAEQPKEPPMEPKYSYRFAAAPFVSALHPAIVTEQQGPVPPHLPPPRRHLAAAAAAAINNSSGGDKSFNSLNSVNGIRRPIVNDLSPASGNYERLLTTKQQNYPPYQQPGPHQQPHLHQQQHGPNGSPYMGYPGYAQVNPYVGNFNQQPGNAYNMPYMGGQQQFNVPGGAPSMSRTSSQAASERPNSSTGQVQTPVSTHAALAVPGAPGSAQKTPAGAAGAQFVKPKKNAIVIKNPQGETLDFNKMAPASPGPNTPAVSRTPPVPVSATPPPQSKPATPAATHTRTESASVGKSAEQLRNEFKEQVRKTAGTPTEADSKAKAAEPAKAEEKKSEPVIVSSTPAVVSTPAPAKAEEKTTTAPVEKAAEAAKTAEVKEPTKEPATEPAKADAAPATPAEDEEDEMERMIREMEEAEAKREAEAAAYEIKKKERAAEEKRKLDADRAANAAANDEKLREQEREMERLEEERERQRKQNEAAAASGGKVKSVAEVLAEKISDITLSDRKESAAASSTDALTSKLGDLKITDRTGPALSPSSETSAGKRAKPSALNLAPINTKSVEPPQPSAALQSLKTARFLRDPTAIMYPKGIQSPNPALNPAVNKKGNFKYDMGFLLQFKDVFVEKPSLDFDQQVKQLIGDGEGASRSGTRTPAGSNAGRQNSRTNAAAAFTSTGAMGSFNSKPLPPGTTSEQRFAMASGSMPRPVGAMSSFGRPGGFPGPSNMTRTPSSSIGGGMPNSPRQGSRSTRGNSRQAGHNAKAEAQAAKTMPLTQGMELKPISISASGWKPTSIANRAPGAAGAGASAPGATPTTMDPDMVQRKVKAALNKMTPEKFDKISDQILTIALQSKDEEDGRTLRQVIQLTFEKATDEAHWAPMYARFCKCMLDRMSPEIRDVTIKDKKGDVISGGTLFRKYLLNRCQQEFERGWKVDLPQPKEGESKETAMLSDEYYEAAAAKRRGLGLVQFIGELYKLGMLTERIMHECVRKLVDYETTPDEAEIESLSKLLRTVGANLDGTDKGRPMMDAYFVRIKNVIDIPDLPSRLKFMLMDVVDLRNRNWVSTEANKGPKTLEEVRQDAEADAAAKALEAARSTSQRGAGGRPGLGRGDSRNFSYNQPIPNQVGMDDLRRLKGSASRIASSSVTTLGPTSMFASRSNSGRRNVPGGSFGRPGDDSGPASRTSTPPTRQDSNTVSHSNAFEALANVDTESPASPPSTAASPALTKSSLDKVSK
ncbi:translation initiation factor 4G [Sporothrix schenckii 1099-18]|uniref:Translation initiation factor 4G n=1 Tax=Sporothrix schenckii 1099-18 TaxID=1397361 RepID=A0A0F2LXY0_SPOSC|nr:translation initiation factor 4G [Sporothrix schenckii 1099-18]KJR82327.1 translation initiation factor 4G [Sporothrix schenckii 1099-18]